MERPIKFRAWYEGGRRMIYGTPNFKHQHFYDDRGLGIDFRVLKLMQDTGLQDKNGKPIYEGDIIQLVHDDGERVKLRVFWAEHAAGFGMEELDGWDPMTKWGGFRNVEDKEVIGNIFENEDLLAETSPERHPHEDTSR